MYPEIMTTQQLPGGWEYEGWAYTPVGCLQITVSYRDHVTYVVTWHTNDTIAMTGSDGTGTTIPADPAPIAVAMAVATEYGLSPRYRSQTGPWN
jgi:hypothetical protein